MTKALELLPDADRVCSDFLAQLAALVGVEFNPDIDILRQRDEIKRAVEVYKTKVTLSGIESIVETITNQFVVVHENTGNVFRFNVASSTFLDPTNIQIANSLNQPGDLLDRWMDTSLVGGIYSPDKLFVYILLKPGEPFPFAVLNKLNRILVDFVPANIEFIFILSEQAFDETLLTEAVDESDDIITNWLNFNTLGDEFTDSDIMFVGDVGYRV